MKHSLTIVFITARQDPKFNWFFDSLDRVCNGDYGGIQVIVIDSHYDQIRSNQLEASCDALRHSNYEGGRPIHTLPKPSVWQGRHRLTSADWWDISGAKNTGICLAKSEWVSFADDRCVLAPTWLRAVRDAMDGDYAVSGSYSKHVGMVVENGIITNPGITIGVDSRNPKGHIGEAEQTFGDSWYGCTSALPLEWCLEMNGWEETCSGLGLEDVVFGNMLVQNNHITKFDPKMRLFEDRSPEACVNMPLRTDKGPFSTNFDKSHKLLEKCCGHKRCQHPFDIRVARNRALAGEPWEIPTEPSADWFDGEALKDFYVR